MSDNNNGPSKTEWQPIETAPKGEIISIWISDKKSPLGDLWGQAEMWPYCYYDKICGDWRTTRPSGHLRLVPERFVTHWLPKPSAPNDHK